MNELSALGWCAHFEAQLDPRIVVRCAPGRIVEQQRELLLVADISGERWCRLSGRLRHSLEHRVDFPVIGDWVEVLDQQITRILKRKSQLVRKDPATLERQVLCANIDMTLIVSALNDDHNLRRIERYVTLAWESESTPVVVLTKSDLCTDVQSEIDRVPSVAPGVRVIATSAHTGEGVEQLRSTIGPKLTAALVGSSGVGKSTLVNRLLGTNRQVVQQVSTHLDKGRHTTTARTLLSIPGCGMVIDTPGMREIQIADVDTGLDQTFQDISGIASRCRFRDCSHIREPGCAVREALENGQLNAERFRNYLKLQREADYEARLTDANLARAERLRWKKISQMARKRPKRWEM